MKCLHLVVSLQCLRMGVSKWYLAGINISHIHVRPKRPRIHFTFGEENWAKHLLSDMCSCSFLVCCLLHVSRLTGKICAGGILKKERSEGSCAVGVSLLLLLRFSLLFEAYVLWFGGSTKVECIWSMWAHVVVLNPWWTDSEPVDNHQLISAGRFCLDYKGICFCARTHMMHLCWGPQCLCQRAGQRVDSSAWLQSRYMYRLSYVSITVLLYVRLWGFRQVGLGTATFCYVSPECICIIGIHQAYYF